MFFQTFFFKGGWRKCFRNTDPTHQSTRRQPAATLSLQLPHHDQRAISADCRQAISGWVIEDPTTHYYEQARMNSFFVPLMYIYLQAKCVSQAQAICQHRPQWNKSLLSKFKGTNNIKRQKQWCKAHMLFQATVVNIKKSIITSPLQYFVSGGRIFKEMLQCLSYLLGGKSWLLTKNFACSKKG